MKIIRRIKIILEDRRNLWNMILIRFAKYFKDETYVKMKYRLWIGKEPNLTNPQTFNEKLNWLKLYYHNPQQTIMADKYWKENRKRIRCAMLRALV